MTSPGFGARRHTRYDERLAYEAFIVSSVPPRAKPWRRHWLAAFAIANGNRMSAYFQSWQNEPEPLLNCWRAAAAASSLDEWCWLVTSRSTGAQPGALSVVSWCTPSIDSTVNDFIPADRQVRLSSTETYQRIIILSTVNTRLHHAAVSLYSRCRLFVKPFKVQWCHLKVFCAIQLFFNFWHSGTLALQSSAPECPNVRN